MLKTVCILFAKRFKPGDPAPSGYIDWHDWARVQHASGLRQGRCPGCNRWRFPQEKCCIAQRPGPALARED